MTIQNHRLRGVLPCFALLGLTLSLLAAPAAAQVESDKWTVLAIGIVLNINETDPVEAPPEPDPDALDPSQIQPGDPGQISDCSSLLEQFLANTEYLQPLLDYFSCSAGGAQDVLMGSSLGLESFSQALLGYSREVRDYVVAGPELLPTARAGGAFVCTLGTGATKLGGNFLRVEGDTRCASPASAPAPQSGVDIEGRIALVDFLNGNQQYRSGLRSGDGALAVRQARRNLTPNRLLKTKYETSIAVPDGNCAGGACQVVWVVLPNKNPNTGSSLPCVSNPMANMLSCTVDSRPFNQSTLN